MFTISIIPIIIAIYWSVSLFRLIYALLKNRKTPEILAETEKGKKNGESSGTRTLDTRLKRAVLYLLS